jgi:hypothetical protein
VSALGTIQASRNGRDEYQRGTTETATLFVDGAPNLREAKRMLRETLHYGYGRGELEAELIASLREVKPPKPRRKRATPTAPPQPADDAEREG